MAEQSACGHRGDLFLLLQMNIGYNVEGAVLGAGSANIIIDSDDVGNSSREFII